MFFWVTYDVEKNGVAVKEGIWLFYASTIFMVFDICVDNNTHNETAVALMCTMMNLDWLLQRRKMKKKTIWRLQSRSLYQERKNGQVELIYIFISVISIIM